MIVKLAAESSVCLLDVDLVGLLGPGVGSARASFLMTANHDLLPIATLLETVRNFRVLINQ